MGVGEQVIDVERRRERTVPEHYLYSSAMFERQAY